MTGSLPILAASVTFGGVVSALLLIFFAFLLWFCAEAFSAIGGHDLPDPDPSVRGKTLIIRGMTIPLDDPELALIQLEAAAALPPDEEPHKMEPSPGGTPSP